ncbi:4777_t:CDS:2 [Dentiscutata erythropus]|uniref:4777_t:CDS:1 n=1 Tax=Dentiscutata erythropus TaxID=1348616 RepID=A0A9N9ITA1_9GLOM|nr:4777_t:CDS:2 [Dentiscutata erythropus]
MLPSHNKVTEQPAEHIISQPINPHKISPPKTSVAVTSNTPKPSGATAGSHSF